MAERKELNDKTRAYLIYVADQLRQGFSGTFTLTCSEGGIRNFNEAKDVKLQDLPAGRRLAG